MMFEGLEWALLKGMMYGLVVLLALWGAATIVESGIRMIRRGSATKRARGEITLELAALYRAKDGSDGTEETEDEPASVGVARSAHRR